MANIEGYVEGSNLPGVADFWYRISGGDHYRAEVRIYPLEGEPAVSTQKVDAFVRSYNPNLRLDEKYKLLSHDNGSVRCWVRIYWDDIPDRA